MDTGLILAIDLGKFKSVACAYPRQGGTPAFHTVPSTREALLGLLGRDRPAVVVIEACALAGWVHDLCAEAGLPCKVANTAGEAWRFKNLKRKTDKDDALRLAQLEALGQLPTVAVPSPDEVLEARRQVPSVPAPRSGAAPLQTSDAPGAAARPGPDARAAVVELNKRGGLSHGKVTRCLEGLFGIPLSSGGSAHAVLRAASRCEPAYENIRQPTPVGLTTSSGMPCGPRDEAKFRS
jgi:hypothetical protein